MRLVIVVLFALLAAILVPLIAHSEGLSSSGTCDTRWHEGGLRMVSERHGGGIPRAERGPHHPSGDHTHDRPYED